MFLNSLFIFLEMNRLFVLTCPRENNVVVRKETGNDFMFVSNLIFCIDVIKCFLYFLLYF